MKLQGTMIISRPQDSTGREYMSLQFVDETSHVQFLEVEIELDAFTRALTSQTQPCTLELRGLQRIGATLEHKTERIKIPERLPRDGSQDDQYLQPFEVDGWSAHRSDLHNHHRLAFAQDGYVARVSFNRHVRDGVPIKD